MVVSRALRATGCANCRLNLLRSFTSIAGLPTRTPHLTAKPSLQTTTPRVRFLSTAHDGEHDRGVQSVETNEEEHEGIIDQDLLEEYENGSSGLAAVPWYLEVNPPQRSPQPLSERQRIPELPESPPSILQPLLQQVSVDLGLYSITLLDLRRLDPPPALGANLLMLIGTARSEKHLHVSADRLCRWLRSTYKLRPDADGLLGRNELKLKLKRKSKRAKLLGKSTADNDDDGVRTGWVCVDVGVVDGVENSKAAVTEPQDFVGFGRRTDAVRIVVQMLTEEKREEMDLEKLWRGILKRGVSSEMEVLEEVPGSESSSSVTDHTLIRGPPIKRLGDRLSISNQSRGFHTSARNFLEKARVNGLGISSTETSDPTINTMNNLGLIEIEQSVALFIRTGHFNEAVDYLSRNFKDIPDLQHEGRRRVLLGQLRIYLEHTSKDKALLDLGRDSSDHESTAFLKCFYRSLSLTPSGSEWDMVIWLHCYARELGHDGYDFYGLMRLFSELQITGIEISTGSYIRLLRSALSPLKIEGKYDSSPRYMVESAVKLLQAMYDRGHKILTEDVFVVLQEAIVPAPLSESERSSMHRGSSVTFDLPSLPMSPIQRRIHVLMKSIDMPTFQVQSKLRLLDLYSRHNHWVEFWDIWRLTLRQGQPQTAPLYAFMFSRIAETKHQKACISVLRTWFPDIEREVPPIRLESEGEVAQAVKACLLVADPFFERDASDPNSKGEWITLWRKCTQHEC